MKKCFEKIKMVRYKKLEEGFMKGKNLFKKLTMTLFTLVELVVM